MMRELSFKPFLVFIVAAGVAALLFSLPRLPIHQLDWRFLLLLVAMAAIAARLSVPIPYVKGEVTVGDTLIFLTMMLYGGEAAVVIAAVDGLSSSLYVSKKLRVWVFNSAQMAFSTFLTVWTVRLCLGPIRDLDHGGYSIVFLGGGSAFAGGASGCHFCIRGQYKGRHNHHPLVSAQRNFLLWAPPFYLRGASPPSGSAPRA